MLIPWLVSTKVAYLKTHFCYKEMLGKRPNEHVWTILMTHITFFSKFSQHWTPELSFCTNQVQYRVAYIPTDLLSLPLASKISKLSFDMRVRTTVDGANNQLLLLSDDFFFFVDVSHELALAISIKYKFKPSMTKYHLQFISLSELYCQCVQSWATERAPDKTVEQHRLHLARCNENPSVPHLSVPLWSVSEAKIKPASVSHHCPLPGFHALSCRLSEA